MQLTNPLRRGALAVALAMSIATAALAGDETTIRVRTAAGPVERVTVADIGNFKVGEGRALTTAAGNYALLRRESEKYVLEVAGERFELNDFASMDAAGHGAHHGDGKHVVLRKHVDKQVTDTPDGKRRVVHIVEADGSDAIAMHDGASLDELDADGAGPRVTVMRRVTREQAAAQ